MSPLLENLKQHINVLCEFDRVPHSKGYQETQTYIEDCIHELGHPVFRHDFRHLPVGRCRNIYTETGPEEGARILIGAHYDSKASSGVAADDNASAVAVALELLARAPQDIPMTFVFFDVEENFGLGGLHGSRAFSKFYKPELSKVIIFDLIGGVFAPGFEHIYFQFGNALPSIEDSSLNFLRLPMKLLEPFGKLGARSDYDAFRRKGIPFCFFSSGTPWYYHTPFDTPDILNFNKMQQFVDSISEQIFKKPDSLQKNFESQGFDKFVKSLSEIEELNSDLIQKLIRKGSASSRIDIFKMHLEVIPKLKRLRKEVWKS